MFIEEFVLYFLDPFLLKLSDIVPAIEKRTAPVSLSFCLFKTISNPGALLRHHEISFTWSQGIRINMIEKWMTRIRRKLFEHLILSFFVHARQSLVIRELVLVALDFHKAVIGLEVKNLLTQGHRLFTLC